MSTAGSFNISQTRYRDVRENFVTAHFSKLTPPPPFFWFEFYHGSCHAYFFESSQELNQTG